MGLLCTLAMPSSARAADTLEPFGIGATDVDFYVGYEGVGQRNLSDQGLFGELMLGYGLLERLSAFVGTNLQGAATFTDGSANLYLGIYGTPLDTKHVDLDLILTVGGGGAGFREFSLLPGFELNFNLDPDMKSWGMYLKGGVLLQGTAEEDPVAADAPCRFSYELLGVLGMYYTIAKKHQLLLEADLTFRPEPCDDARRVELGGVALGYNVTLSDRIELINQVFLDIPQPGERFAAGFMFGFIVTLPSVKMTPPAVAPRIAPRTQLKLAGVAR